MNAELDWAIASFASHLAIDAAQYGLGRYASRLAQKGMKVNFKLIRLGRPLLGGLSSVFDISQVYQALVDSEYEYYQSHFDNDRDDKTDEDILITEPNRHHARLLGQFVDENGAPLTKFFDEESPKRPFPQGAGRF
ncbi:MULTISPECIES: hypothetical protein [Candidatus Williamhamiltonella]|uniref:Uncharacterized protein n=1 Tax=Candidatus Williamhamiltonella defendens TaxID=138072 RepID=A0A2D3TCM8_9ENTR|nr:hypothetical protein [Candidatus Hamiltonella defensa]ATW33567.1 hypothetical protein BJP43_03930 [Candidatus Hamiltonella defensa]